MELGLEFLKKVNSGLRQAFGKKVAVIGGGNVAIDVARVLLRLGAEPIIVYRRTENEMPALREEVQVAKEEGVQFEFLTQPIQAEKSQDKILLKCVRMKLGNPPHITWTRISLRGRCSNWSSNSCRSNSCRQESSNLHRQIFNTEKSKKRS